MYFSVASRTTQARETFFSFAIVSRVSYTSDGKLIDARTHAALWEFVALATVFFALAIEGSTPSSPLYTISVKPQHDIAEFDRPGFLCRIRLSIAASVAAVLSLFPE
jgi:hypothetical protein